MAFPLVELDSGVVDQNLVVQRQRRCPVQYILLVELLHTT